MAVMLLLLGGGASPGGPTGLFPAGGCQNSPCRWLNSWQVWDVVDCEGSCCQALLQISMPQGDSGQMLMGFCFSLVGRKLTGLLPPLPLRADRELVQCCPGMCPCPPALALHCCEAGVAGSLIPLGICPSALLHVDTTQLLSPFPTEGLGLNPRSQGSQ